MVGCFGDGSFLLFGLFVSFLRKHLAFYLRLLRVGQKRKTDYPKQIIKVTDSVLYTNFVPKLCGGGSNSWCWGGRDWFGFFYSGNTAFISRMLENRIVQGQLF